MDFWTMNMDMHLEENAPLADKMRPENIDEFVGQEHILSEGKYLNRTIKADRISSMIFYGPPGTGKTTLATIIANTTKMNFEKLSAVTSGVKDIREVIHRAEEGLKISSKKTILFIDEIHRFNKSQQDALLPHVEKGLIILIGATTENPYFEVNKALLSRVHIIELKSLNDNALKELVQRAIYDKERGLGNYSIHLTGEALDYLLRISNGDARIILNSLEVGVLSTEENEDGIKYVDLETIKDCIQIKVANYDKSGDEHYNTISAFIKSMRGSDPDATLYWLAKMINAGEDPKFIARRIIIAAAEDVGNADSQALILAQSAFEAINVIGMPEGRIVLSQAALYVANAPKSNSAYKGIDLALEDIKKEKTQEIPSHLKDAHYSGAKKLGHGKNYLYPHDYGGDVKQDYLPENLVNKQYYFPSSNGEENID